MHDFIFLEGVAHTFFDFRNHIIQIRIRYFLVGTCANLNDEHRVYIGIMLLISILIPVLALILPFVCCSLEYGHVTVFDWIFRISDYNTIFEQSRLTNLGRRNNHLMQCRVCCLPDKGIKTFGSCTHSDNDRNGRQILLAAALDKTLHDGGSCSRLASLHTAVCLINNEIQTVSFFSCRIFNGLPNRILSRIRMTAQITGLAKLLRIQKIDMTVLQNLLVERFIRNHYALIYTNLICFQLDLLLGLFIQLRRIRKPYENGLRLFSKLLRAVKDIFNQGRHDNRFARTRWCLKRNHLRDLQHAIVIQRHRHAEAHFIDRLFLKWE